MKALLFFCFILFACAAIAQEQPFRPVNRDSVKQAVTDTALSTYYPKLFDRFQHFDTTLTLDDYRLLYYGFVFQDGYSGYPDEKKREIRELVGKKKYDRASELCDVALHDVPVGLTPHLLKAMVLYNMTDNDSSQLFARRYRMLRDAILSTGNGLSCNTAYKTIYVSDEYEILKNLKLESEGQSLVYPCDALHVSPSEYFEKTLIYFDTSESFIFMQQQLKDKK